MSPDQKPGLSSHIVIGGIAILLGILFLLGNLGYISDVHYYLRFWPALLVVFGAIKAAQSGSPGGRTWGAVIAVVGVLMLLNRAHFLSVDLWALWPLALVAMGGSILWHTATARRRMRDGEPSPENESFVNGTAIMGGFKRTNASKDFRGGELTAIMGGIELDLRQSAIRPGGEATLNIEAIMGGVEIRVPGEWTVVLQGTPVLGGYDDKTYPPQSANAPRLVIKGTAIMGGVEIKN
jgi:predicted membrane protein